MVRIIIALLGIVSYLLLIVAAFAGIYFWLLPWLFEQDHWGATTIGLFIGSLPIFTVMYLYFLGSRKD